MLPNSLVLPWLSWNHFFGRFSFRTSTTWFGQPSWNVLWLYPGQKIPLVGGLADTVRNTVDNFKTFILLTLWKIILVDLFLKICSIRHPFSSVYKLRRTLLNRSQTALRLHLAIQVRFANVYWFSSWMRATTGTSFGVISWNIIPKNLMTLSRRLQPECQKWNKVALAAGGRGAQAGIGAMQREVYRCEHEWREKVARERDKVWSTLFPLPFLDDWSVYAFEDTCCRTRQCQPATDPPRQQSNASSISTPLTDSWHSNSIHKPH